MDEVVTASPGEDSPLLNTEADTVYLPVTVSGGNAEVIAGSETGEGAAVDSPEGNSPYTVVFSADAPDCIAVYDHWRRLRMRSYTNGICMFLHIPTHRRRKMICLY